MKPYTVIDEDGATLGFTYAESPAEAVRQFNERRETTDAAGAIERTEALEFCHSNSIGPHYQDPSCINTFMCTPAEAKKLLSTPMVNGFFWRRQEDRTGN